jgi:hypothetical protein
MVGSPPSHLAPAVELLSMYLADEKQQAKPFLAVGEYGWGRGHWIAETLRSYGYSPRWLYEAEILPSADLDGNLLFPVYDVPKATIRSLPTPCVVLVGTDFDRKSQTYKEHPWGPFGKPERWHIEDALTALGLPIEAANGNETYATAILAGRIFQSTGVFVESNGRRSKTWGEVRSGGPPPVDDHLLPYYLAYAFPPSDSSWNRALYLRDRKLSDAFGEFILGAIRAKMPTGELSFPRILKTPKQNGEKKAEQNPELPLLEKKVKIVW